LLVFFVFFVTFVPEREPLVVSVKPDSLQRCRLIAN
jgi:hypothetical protein